MLANCIRDLSRALRDHDWCLIGAQAAILYGSTRTTLDVDISVRAEPAEAGDLLLRLAAAGFTPRIDDLANFAARTRVLLLAHESSGLSVDLVLAGPGLEEIFLARAHATRVFGTNVPVLAPEDLVASKLLAGRPHDIEDVAAVMKNTPDLVDSQIEETLRLFEQALDRSDLMSTFEQLRRSGCD